MSLRSLALQNNQKSRVRLRGQLMAAEIFRNFLIMEPKLWSLGLFENDGSVIFVLDLY